MIAPTLISESGPKIVRSPHPRSERESPGGCRTFDVNLHTLEQNQANQRFLDFDFNFDFDKIFNTILMYLINFLKGFFEGFVR